MKKVKKEMFYVVGISVRTTNENNQAKKDIGDLWQKFMSENMFAKITNRVEYSIYAVYTDYEKDHTKPYTTILGFKVSNLDTVPEGMIGKKNEASTYEQFSAKGDLTKSAVIDKWMEIWNMDLDRTYTSDFEIYGEKAQDPTNGEVDIFIATN
jgi:predicted transcriptional regulator YdeE